MGEGLALPLPRAQAPTSSTFWGERGTGSEVDPEGTRLTSPTHTHAMWKLHSMVSNQGDSRERPAELCDLLQVTYVLCALAQFSSVQFSRSVVSDSLQPHESQHARPPCPSPTPGVHPNPSFPRGPFPPRDRTGSSISCIGRWLLSC